MRVEEIGSHVCIMLEDTGDIARMLSVMSLWNSICQDTKKISYRIIERLEEGLEIIQ